MRRQRATACQTATSATVAPPATTAGGLALTTPAMTTTAPALNNTSLGTCPLRMTSSLRRTSAAVKCQLQMRIALLSAPSPSRWTSSHPDQVMKGWISVTTTTATSQTTTTALARRCQEVRFMAAFLQMPGRAVGQVRARGQ